MEGIDETKVLRRILVRKSLLMINEEVLEGRLGVKSLVDGSALA